jgi:chloramphenicol O-acetyltransferase type A
MKRSLDIETWNRKEHYRFFSQCDEPLFGIVAETDVTDGYRFCKENDIPFFLYYHFKAISAVNHIEEFRYRIEESEITVYETIHVTTTISRIDNTFAFAFVPFTGSFKEFTESAKTEIERIRNSTGLGITQNTSRSDVIHFSTVPWISFTGVTHARSFKYPDSVPKITFGKYFYKNDRLVMPVSVNVHHGLMDGYHVGKFLELMEKSINDKNI